MLQHARRKLLVGLGALGVSGALGIACSRSPATSGTLAPASPAQAISDPAVAVQVTTTASASRPPGKLVVVLAGSLSILDLTTLQRRQLTHPPKDGFAATPSLSPDRRRIAYTSYVPPTSSADLGGSDLFVVDVADSSPHLVARHPISGASYETPFWTADGSALLATKRVTESVPGKPIRVTLSVVRLPLNGDPPTDLLPNATSATLSPDGKRLAYVAVNAAGLSIGLMIAGPDGKGARRLSFHPAFSLLGSPAFAPDNTRLAFAGSAGMGPAAPSVGPARGWTPLAVTVAEAHNAYWEIWSVDADGTNLTQLTNLSEDNPVPAWSPDGRWIAVAGEMGLYLVDPVSRMTTHVGPIHSSGIDWLA